MIKTTELLTFPGSVCRPGTKLRAFRGVTIYDTGNTSPTANARAHAELLRGAWQTRDTSWHYAVDQDGAYQSIPEAEISWHAGDGSQGPGNNETISIETCINAGGDYEITLGNAAELAADILYRHGATSIEKHLFQHYDWSGKDCPHVIRSTGRWPSFSLLVQQRLNELNVPPAPDPEPADVPTYTIKPGDTFWGISRRLNIPLQIILDANPGVDPMQLHIGQVIQLQAADPAYLDHTIVRGDTFWGLAQQYEVSVPEILAANPGVDPYQLEIGQKIRIPR